MENIHNIYLEMCESLAKLSKCKKNQVASMIVSDGRIISTGINGTPSGFVNCQDNFCNHSYDSFYEQHSEWSLKYEIHAEMNSIIFAAKNGISIPSGSILYCTHEPCDNCLKHIVGSGIKEIYYRYKYYNNIVENNFNIKITQIINE